MSSCCNRPVTPKPIRQCPVSATSGKEVDLQTVKALLREHPLRRVSTIQHHFCADPACDVVYFDEGGAVYLKDEIRVPVWQKEPSGRRMICYCFDENEAGMLAECEQTGATASAGRDGCQSVHDLLSRKLKELDSRRVELEEFSATLRTYLATCERALKGQSNVECPVVEDLGTRKRAAVK
jgi:hypothetical protein